MDDPNRRIRPGDSLWTPDPNREWHFDIDVVGGCNLRCPSCPVGNLTEIRTAGGAMEPALLDAIASKAKAECGDPSISLYNWTEPFLHPKLAEMIRVVRSHDLRCMVSTNLNLLKDADGVLAAGPKELRVSVSGFSQERYGITHERGDIEVVKRHMRELAEAKERVRSTTRLTLAFHRYLGNHGEEADMKRFSESLGFEFTPNWAYLMPLEKVLAYAGSEAVDVEVTSEDHTLIDRFALPLDRALDVARKHRDQPCTLRDSQMALTVTGDVMLCCAVYDQSRYSLGSYLDTPLEELQTAKFRHDLCGPCMTNGIHVLGTYAAEELQDVASEHVAKHFPEVQLAPTRAGRTGRKKPKSRLARKARKQLIRIRERLGLTPPP